MISKKRAIIYAWHWRVSWEERRFCLEMAKPDMDHDAPQNLSWNENVLTRVICISGDRLQYMIHAKTDGESYRTRFGNGQHECFADTTPDKGGQNAGFRPHDLLEAALACCVTMTAQMFAKKNKIPLRAVHTTVRLNRESANETMFEVQAEFDGDLTSEQIQRLRTAIQNCPVRKTLSRPIRFDEADPASAG